MNIKNIETALLPCPFCGGNAKKFVSYNYNYNKKIKYIKNQGVRCSKCGAEICNTTYPELAIEKWNKRNKTVNVL